MFLFVKFYRVLSCLSSHPLVWFFFCLSSHMQVLFCLSSPTQVLFCLSSPKPVGILRQLCCVWQVIRRLRSVCQVIRGFSSALWSRWIELNLFTAFGPRGMTVKGCFFIQYHVSTSSRSALVMCLLYVLVMQLVCNFKCWTAVLWATNIRWFSLMLCKNNHHKEIYEMSHTQIEAWQVCVKYTNSRCWRSIDGRNQLCFFDIQYDQFRVVKNSYCLMFILVLMGVWQWHL